MVRRDGASLRQERILKLTRFVMSRLHQSPNTEISLSKTIAILQYEYGLTEDRIMEYLRIPEKVGRFEIDVEDDVIRLNELTS